jgi:hypothetical protein
MNVFRILLTLVVMTALLVALVTVPDHSAAQSLPGMTYLGTVIERDSSTWIEVRVQPPVKLYKGEQSQLLRVGGQRLSWTNSQGEVEWVTLPQGVTHVIVNRAPEPVDNRRIDFRAYQQR